MKKQLLYVPAFLLAAAGALNAQTVIFSEDFQSTTGTSIPATWTQTTTSSDGGWKSGTALNSTYFPIPAHTRYLATNDDQCNCNKSNDFLVTPSIALTGVTYPQLTFDAFNPGQSDGTYTEKTTVEVSTNGGSTWTVLQTLAAMSGWTSVSVDRTSYVGQTVMIGFRYNDGGGWMYGCALDNVKVIDPQAKEGATNSIVMNKYVLAGSQAITAIFQNNGGAPVTSLTMKYSVDGGTPVQQTFSPSGVAYNNTYNAVFTTQAALTAGLHTVKAWITDINTTGADSNPANDTASFFVTVQSSQPNKKVLVEEFTGAWCGYCPRGGVTLGQITTDTNIVGAAIHDNDNMSTTEGNTVISAYASGFPSGMVDRAYYTPGGDWTLDDSQWQTFATTRRSAVVPAVVGLSNISYNSSTRQISVTVNATFVASVKGNYAINCYVVENHIYGPLNNNTDNNWNQHSYYYGDNTSPFYQTGYLPTAGDQSLAYLLPNNYQHMHVVDKMMGGSYGDNTVVPTSVVPANTTYTKTFTYTMPAADPGGAHRYHEENVYLVGIISEYNTSNKDARYILNVTESKLIAGPESLGPLSVHDIAADFGNVSIYPNPTSSNANVSLDLKSEQNVKISVYDAFGRLVRSESHSQLSAGNHLFNLNTADLTSGIYSVMISTDNGSVTKKITVTK